jgi:hypothetical protein
MSTETYAIVFRGETVEGFEAATVQAQLAKLLKLDPKKAQALFSGKQVVLKKTADKMEATRYGKALKKVGADVKIRVIKSDDAPAAPKSSRRRAKPAAEKADAPVFQAADDAPVFQKADDAPAFQPADDVAKADPEPAPVAPAADPAAAEAAPVVDTSGITLAPNEGDLFEPVPATEAPAIDLSEYEVADLDDTPLVEPAEEVVVELDLSAFTVSENDGELLVEPADEVVPVVEAPDFGLDEPGAVLETIQEEKEIVNPNTMGMTIAAAGVDLIEDEEKPPAPVPNVPDTSNIHLVPNFDT